MRAVSGDSVDSHDSSVSSDTALIQSTRDSNSPDASTNPTSVSISTSAAPSEIESSKESQEKANAEMRRSVRSRSNIATYSDTILSGHAVHTRKSFRDPKDYALAAASRTVSGATLVNEAANTPKGKLALTFGTEDDISEHVQTPKSASTSRVSRRKSIRASAISAVTSVSSVLGKRSRDALDSAKSKLQSLGRSASLRTRTHGVDGDDSPAKKRLRASNNRVYVTDSDEEDEEEDEAPAPTKKKPGKIWLEKGLYVGQTRTDQPTQKGKRGSNVNAMTERIILPMPMFTGELWLKHGRDFKLPFDILNPLAKNEAPKDWRNLTRSKF
jgi:hypothetical protein